MMNKKLALVAASVIALSAHANAQDAQPAAEDQGPLETLFSDEQPPLEGDSPLADDAETVPADADDALIGDGYAEDDAEMRATEPSLAETTPPLATPDADVIAAEELDDVDAEQDDPAFADTDPTVTDPAVTDPTIADEPMIAEGDPAMQSSEPMADEPTDGFAATDTDADVDADQPMMAADEAETTEDSTFAETGSEDMGAESEPLPARDAKIAAVPTDPTEAVAEAALIAGTYEVSIPNRPGTSTLFIEGRGTEAAGTFDGQPIDVIVTGRNFSFDAPVTMDGEEQLMTFAGTAEDGVIDNGVIEAQGDGGYMTFDARRVDASMDAGMDTDAFGSDAADLETDADVDMGGDMDGAETGFGVTDEDVLDDAGDDDGFEGTYEDDTDTNASLDADVPADFSTGAEDREDAAAAAAGFEEELDGADRSADDMGTDDMGMESMDTDVDASMDTDVPADLSTGAEDREDAAAAAAGFEEELGSESASDALTTDGGLERDADAMDADTDMDADAMETEDADEAGDPNFQF